MQRPCERRKAHKNRYFGPFRFRGEHTLKISKQSCGASETTIDYSIYTLPELFNARYWADTRGSSLEEEIQKRCTHIHEQINCRPSAVAGSISRFRPYGLRFGVVFLILFVGPFAAVKFLAGLNVIGDVNGDMTGLTGVWALFTFPIMVVIFLIGARIDVERVVKWFNLDGRQIYERRQSRRPLLLSSRQSLSSSFINR
jgi:hypothetical protein